VAFRRISTALARSLPPPKTEEARAQLGWVAERPQNLAAWHAAQAGLWAMIGSETLAEVHEDLALGVDEIDDDARWTILISRSRRVSRVKQNSGRGRTGGGVGFGAEESTGSWAWRWDGM
jgi:anaphase-promoting complex subunit 5